MTVFTVSGWGNIHGRPLPLRSLTSDGDPQPERFPGWKYIKEESAFALSLLLRPPSMLADFQPGTSSGFVPPPASTKLQTVRRRIRAWRRANPEPFRGDLTDRVSLPVDGQSPRHFFRIG